PPAAGRRGGPGRGGPGGPGPGPGCPPVPTHVGVRGDRWCPGSGWVGHAGERHTEPRRRRHHGVPEAVGVGVPGPAGTVLAGAVLPDAAGAAPVVVGPAAVGVGATDGLGRPGSTGRRGSVRGPTRPTRTRSSRVGST